MHDSFALTLLDWFDQNGRDLPWRRTRDPYAIWLSEIILQQTRVQQGWQYWERFMSRWPSVELLAAASEDEVLRLWQGLGYYSRARNLHTAARQIAERGSFPSTYEEIRQLKGVGNYTAAAIASMAFDLPHAVVDGNVYRVLARHYGIHTPINTTEGKKEFALLAQQLLPADKAAAYNQAIMDFGAIQCTPQSPRCLLCPLQESCVALREGLVDQLPVKLKTLQVKERRLAYIYIRYRSADDQQQGRSPLTAIRRRGAGDIWQGLWEPLAMSDDMLAVLHLNEPTLADRPHLQLIKQSFRHVLTHRILLCDFFLLETQQQPVLPSDYRWVSEDELEHYAFPRMLELLFGMLPSPSEP
jgi:A/G-specific adenine glycosylase